MSTMTLAADHAVLSEIEAAEFAALPEARQSMLQVIWGKLKVAGEQTVSIIVRFVRWLRNAFIGLFGSPLTLAGLLGGLALANERVYHGAVSLVEGAVDIIRTGLSWLDKAISWVVGAINDGFIWLLSQFDDGWAKTWSEWTFKFSIAKHGVYNSIGNRVDTGLRALRTLYTRRIAAGAAIGTSALVAANMMTGGALAAATPAWLAGYGSVTLFTPLGIIAMVGAVMLGSFLAGFALNEINENLVEPNPIYESHHATLVAAEKAAEAQARAEAEAKRKAEKAMAKAEEHIAKTEAAAVTEEVATSEKGTKAS